MIIGFGITEIDIEKQIAEECIEAYKIKGVDGIEIVSKKYADDAELYGKMSREESPERYSYFFHNTV